MLRAFLFTVVSLYLIAVGLWPAAAAPVSLAVAGLAVLIGLVSGPVWALIVGVVWLWHRRTVAIPAAAVQPATAWED